NIAPAALGAWVGTIAGGSSNRRAAAGAASLREVAAPAVRFPGRTVRSAGQNVRFPGRRAATPSGSRGAGGGARVAPLGRVTPLHDRPRERLLQLGGDALSTGELIALVLGTGTAGRPATEIARALLEQSGDLLALSRADARELAATPGVGLARACRLVAAFQLGRRVMTPPLTGAVLAGPADVFHHLRGRVRGLEQELFFVIAVDARNAITCEIEIARGSLTAVDVHPREVFRP